MGKFTEYIPPAIAAVGTAMYGIDTGIIATTVGHDSFLQHMFPPDGEDSTLLGNQFPFLSLPEENQRLHYCP